MSLSIPRAFFHQRSTHGKANDTPRPGPRQCHPSCRCIPTTIAPRPDHESSQAWTSASSGARCEWLTIFSRSPAGPFLHDGEIHRGTFARGWREGGAAGDDQHGDHRSPWERSERPDHFIQPARLIFSLAKRVRQRRLRHRSPRTSTIERMRRWTRSHGCCQADRSLDHLIRA